MADTQLSEGAQETWNQMREFVCSNTERWVKAGWTLEDAQQHSIDLLEGRKEGELTPEGRESLTQELS